MLFLSRQQHVYLRTMAKNAAEVDVSYAQKQIGLR